jgi:hypothetical protein
MKNKTLNRGGILNKQGIRAAITILLVVSIAASFNTTLVKANNENVGIETANSSINQAFTNILIAEKAGGNITELLTKLKSAGELLAEAQNAYNSGNMVNVTSKAENARQIAEQVNGDALNLRDVSLVGSQNSFWLTLIFSVVGGFVFGVSLLVVWRRFKRSYMKKLLGMKPEVAENTP